MPARTSRRRRSTWTSRSNPSPTPPESMREGGSRSSPGPGPGMSSPKSTSVVAERRPWRETSNRVVVGRPLGLDAAEGGSWTRGRSGRDTQGLEGAVPLWLVGDAVLPAAPEHVDPGAGQDTAGVGMGVPAGSMLVVEAVCPRVGTHRVLGEVEDGVAQLLVAGPAEGDHVQLARAPRRGHRAGEGGQGFRAGEAGSAVADLGQQGSSADAAGAGQALEDETVGMEGELLTDLRLQRGDLGEQGAQYPDQGQGHRGLGLGRGPVQAGGSTLEPLQQRPDTRSEEHQSEL